MKAFKFNQMLWVPYSEHMCTKAVVVTYHSDSCEYLSKEASFKCHFFCWTFQSFLYYLLQPTDMHTNNTKRTTYRHNNRTKHRHTCTHNTANIHLYIATNQSCPHTVSVISFWTPPAHHSCCHTSLQQHSTLWETTHPSVKECAWDQDNHWDWSAWTSLSITLHARTHTHTMWNIQLYMNMCH